MIYARVLCIFISEFSHWQEPSPVILLEVDDRLHVRLYDATLLLDLSFYMQIKGDRKPLLETKEVAKR